MKRRIVLSVAFLILALLGLWRSPGIGVFKTAVTAQEKPVEIKIDPKIFDDYTGQYISADNPDFVLSFFREGDKFYIQATDQGRIEIFPASQTKFFPKIIDADATFIRDSSGKVTGLVWRQNNHETPYQKT